MTETTAPVQSLHDQIMRLPCTPPKDANVNQSISYKSGHRDARHAAAELAAEHEAEQQQELTAIEAMARMLADGEWAEHVGLLGGPIARRLEAEITRMHNERHEVYQEACAAVPDVRAMVDRFLGWKLPDDFSPDAGISFSKPSNPAWWPTGTNLLSADQAKALFEHVLAVAQAIPAKPTQADMNAAIDRMRRENNLSIDGDNAYKRDLLDCVIGALAFGKQGSTPPPEDHWLHRFWEIGDAERKERDAAPPAQQGWVKVTQELRQHAQELHDDWCADIQEGGLEGARSLPGWILDVLSSAGDTAAPEQVEQPASHELLPDEIHQIAFEEGQPAENGDGYWFTAEEFDLFVDRLLTRAAPPAQQSQADERREGVEAVAKMIEKKASDYAMEFGHDDLGALSFGAGPYAEAKHDYYNTLCELAEEVRAMLNAPGDTAAPEQKERVAIIGKGVASTEALEQAEQPHPVNRSVIRDVFLRNGFTIKEGHADLKPYVYAAAEELLALDGKAVAAEQDSVKVPRELLERTLKKWATHGAFTDIPGWQGPFDELRALLGGDA